MNGVAPERWRVMSPLLERALELSTEERAGWLLASLELPFVVARLREAAGWSPWDPA